MSSSARLSPQPAFSRRTVVLIGVSPWGSSREGAVAAADAAVLAGADTLWLGDGLLTVPDFPQWAGGLEPFVQLAWLAGRYPSVRVGLGAAVLPLRDVVWVVKQASTLDQLTAGRFDLVVAPGYWRREFEYLGLDFDHRGDRFDDLLLALQAGFVGSSYDGETLRLPEEGRLSPVPFTAGGPRFWLAGGRATFERALKTGRPFQARRPALPRELAPLATEWHDRGGAALALRVSLEVAATVDESRPAETVKGPPSYLAEQVVGYAELGVADLSVRPGQSDEASRRVIDALGDEIIPALRAWHAGNSGVP
jgi:alkanesulfonate monooxygenase SsuD/methylene tetrahydromethanopterin reductase-like flavin-dependent oxidoreductase (luciferase family)